MAVKESVSLGLSCRKAGGAASADNGGGRWGGGLLRGERWCEMGEWEGVSCLCLVLQMENRLLDFHLSNLEFACGASLDKVSPALTLVSSQQTRSKC